MNAKKCKALRRKARQMAFVAAQTHGEPKSDYVQRQLGRRNAVTVENNRATFRGAYRWLKKHEKSLRSPIPASQS